MTSEVVVMNRMGVALAADSVVTVSSGTASKNHDSAVKVFMLSKHHPVGIMIYNNATLLGVPWETLVKMFRRELGSCNFATLEEFGNQLIEFLNGNRNLFPSKVQKEYFLSELKLECRRIEDDAKKKFNLSSTDIDISAEGSVREQRVVSVQNAIEQRVKLWKDRDTANQISERLVDDFFSPLSGKISEVILEVFTYWPVDNKLVADLLELARCLILKDHFASESHTGIVIAGFGKNEHFPSIQHIKIDGMYGDVLKFRQLSIDKISDDMPSFIESFAYKETVDNFLYGISQTNSEHLETAIDLISQMPLVTLDNVEELSGEIRADLRENVRAASTKVADEFRNRIEWSHLRRYRSILEVVQTLPLKELAQVASTLVSLSSFQQHMSLDKETVGGPVDVCVISKGDGFIWIDRKHYFRAELNHHFFDNILYDATKQEENDGKIAKDGGTDFNSE